MPILRKHFDQLATPESWQSPVAVITHIDLDAFYAQCLAVHYNIDPAEPVGCRQWNSLIAINYPARKFGLKRGVSVDEARRLCPQIKLPHVATFRKGELKWDFHEDPDPALYKVSLDHFRRESRKIFAIYKDHFRQVEKAGIDEGFVDLGRDVHRLMKERRPELFENNKSDNQEEQTSSELDISHNDLLDLGAELVNNVRQDIYERLRYTCSAGIAPNKQLAKLGSAYNKPFNQTVVHTDKKYDFLANFRITDAWGWGGKLGKEVLTKLNIPEDSKDQCSFVRDNWSLIDMQYAFGGDVEMASRVWKVVRGESVSEVSPRTLSKSMVAVKNFSKTALKNWKDIDDWLQVYSADLCGRLSDLKEDLGSTVVPKTIGIKYFKGGAQLSRQQAFEIKGTEISELREQIVLQSKKLVRDHVRLPCSYLQVEISHLYELPRISKYFMKQLSPRKKRPASEVGLHDIGDINNDKDKELKLDKGEIHNEKEKEEAEDEKEEESLFVDDENPPEDKFCSRCGSHVEDQARQEHDDWHFATDLHNKELAPSHLGQVKRASETGKVSKRSAPKSTKNAGIKKPSKGQTSITHFFQK